MIVFALYNTFNKIDLISIVLYISCMLTVLILYKGHIIKGLKIIKENINLIKKY